jgi:HTH-type transcriptional regulator/antitoxin HigA
MDNERYGQLLAETRPGIIDSPEEHERLLSIAERLMEKADKLTEEEERLLALIVFVVEAYEASTDTDDDDESESSSQPARPHETLQRLMSARGLQLEDVADIFGNPHIAREVLAGKRTITRGQAKELGRFFQTPLKIFLE